jgi:hypothetical protein
VSVTLLLVVAHRPIAVGLVLGRQGDLEQLLGEQVLEHGQPAVVPGEAGEAAGVHGAIGLVLGRHGDLEQLFDVEQKLQAPKL